MKIEPCGLYIDVENPWLGASPDGIIVKGMPAGVESNAKGLVEMKCPYSGRDLTAEKAIQTVTTLKGLTMAKQKDILNPRHNY